MGILAASSAAAICMAALACDIVNTRDWRSHRVISKPSPLMNKIPQLITPTTKQDLDFLQINVWALKDHSTYRCPPHCQNPKAMISQSSPGGSISITKNVAAPQPTFCFFTRHALQAAVLRDKTARSLSPSLCSDLISSAIEPVEAGLSSQRNFESCVA